jgi:hypothetical protein
LQVAAATMSGLEALSLVSNIFSILSFGGEVVYVLKKVYRDGSMDESLSERSVVLGNISSHIHAVQLAEKPRERHRDLMRAAEKCEMISRDLREEIAFIVGVSSRENLMNTLKVAAKTTWRRRRLDRLERDLTSIEALMNTGILSSIWYVKISVIRCSAW